MKKEINRKKVLIIAIPAILGAFILPFISSRTFYDSIIYDPITIDFNSNIIFPNQYVILAYSTMTVQGSYANGTVTLTNVDTGQRFEFSYYYDAYAGLQGERGEKTVIEMPSGRYLVDNSYFGSNAVKIRITANGLYPDILTPVIYIALVGGIAAIFAVIKEKHASDGYERVNKEMQEERLHSKEKDNWKEKIVNIKNKKE